MSGFQVNKLSLLSPLSMVAGVVEKTIQAHFDQCSPALGFPYTHYQLYRYGDSNHGKSAL